MKLFTKNQRPSFDATLVQELRLALASAEEKILREREEKTVLEMALNEANQHFEEKLDLQSRSNTSLTQALRESRGEVSALQVENETLRVEKRKMEDKAKLLTEQREAAHDHFKMVYAAVKASYGQVKLENRKLLKSVQVLEEQMKKQDLSNAEMEHESQRLREEVARLEAELATKVPDLEIEMIRDELKQEKEKNNDLQKQVSKHKEKLHLYYEEMALVIKGVESKFEEQECRHHKEICSLKGDFEDSAANDEKIPPQKNCKDLFRLKPENKQSPDLRKCTKNLQRNKPDKISAVETQEDTEALRVQVKILQKVARNITDENEEMQRILLEKDQAISNLAEKIEKQHEHEKALIEMHKNALEEQQRDTEISKEELKNLWLLEVNEKSATIACLERELMENKTYQEHFAQELEEKIAQELEADNRTIAQLEEKLKLVERRRQEEIRGMKRVMWGLEESRRQAQKRASALAWRNIFRWRT